MTPVRTSDDGASKVPEAEQPSRNRVILFLQGPPSGFWRQLAAGFRVKGARIVRVNLCAGDILYWLSPGTRTYLGRRADWPAWLARLINAHGITDVIYFADRHPYHAAAAKVAKERGVNHYVVEFGYLRPGWLTLERGGMGVYSHFPSDPEAIRDVAHDLPRADISGDYGHSWVWESFHEIVFHITNLLYRPIFWNYDPDRFYSTIPEYVNGATRHLRRISQRDSYAEIEAECVSGRWPYALYALQLQSDWQIRANSPFTDQSDALDAVLCSMAAHAPEDMRLVVKCHPLDPGMIDWPSAIADLAERHGLTGRVLYIDGGDLQTLMRQSHGVVLINSTVGLQALQMGVPVHAMGVAVYDMPGLTHRAGLDTFWQRPQPVDGDLCDCLVRVLAASIQLRGSFFNRAGKRRAVEAIVSRVLDERVNQPGAFVDPPPRLSQAEVLGIGINEPHAG